MVVTARIQGADFCNRVDGSNDFIARECIIVAQRAFLSAIGHAVTASCVPCPFRLAGWPGSGLGSGLGSVLGSGLGSRLGSALGGGLGSGLVSGL